MSRVILKAIRVATLAHGKQLRKDGVTPYIAHPIRVAELVNEALLEAPSELTKNYDEIVAAALLHDTLEDTTLTVDDLIRTFNLNIASIVLELTDDKSLPKNVRKANQLQNAVRLSEQATLIRIADKIANIMDITSHTPLEWDAKRKKEYIDWAALVVDRMPAYTPPCQYLTTRFKHIMQYQLIQLIPIEQGAPTNAVSL